MTTATKPILKDIVLKSGGHRTRAEGVCVMELAAWLAGREHTAQPPCVSPAIAGFLMSWNDSLDDTARQKLKPYARKVLNTATNAADEQTRGWMATDWLVREFTPAWLRVAGLTEHAEALEKLAPLISTVTAKASMTTISAADSTARSAADSTARSAAYSAAYSAADSAARSAARDVLVPTVKILQKSAFLLLDRMIAVGKTEKVAA